jgi:hypothetical protein
MSDNVLVQLSESLANAAGNVGRSVVTLSPRNRRPADGIAFSDNQFLTANYTIEEEDDIRVMLPGRTEISTSPWDAIPILT